MIYPTRKSRDANWRNSFAKRARRKVYEHWCFENPRRKKTLAGNSGSFPNHCGSGRLTRWDACYETTGTNHWRLTISHSANQPNRYRLVGPDGPADLTGDETAIPFAGSDFWIADFGLEFLFWPEQKILKKEFHKNCACIVLESANPHPATNGYARVVSWIDEESGSVIEAKAYDGSDKPLKDFNLKSLAKVNGHWRVEAVIMDNDQTGSRTRLEFDDFSATNSPSPTTDLLKK